MLLGKGYQEHIVGLVDAIVLDLNKVKSAGKLSKTRVNEIIDAAQELSSACTSTGSIRELNQLLGTLSESLKIPWDWSPALTEQTKRALQSAGKNVESVQSSLDIAALFEQESSFAAGGPNSVVVASTPNAKKAMADAASQINDFILSVHQGEQDFSKKEVQVLLKLLKHCVSMLDDMCISAGLVQDTAGYWERNREMIGLGIGATSAITTILSFLS